MVANEKPGCCGVAARLPKKPGTQKLTPPSSATATVGAAMSAPSTSAEAKACRGARRVIVGCFMTASPAGDDVSLRLPGMASERATAPPRRRQQIDEGLFESRIESRILESQV